jgi:dephospho-CoA kinase
LLFVGLTGGVGSGKSEALAAFHVLGAAVISSDEVVHELLRTEELRDLLAGRWGDGVLSEGEVNRQAVAEIVFESPAELAWLESTLFPRVAAHLAAWRAEIESEDDAELGVVEVPLLFEAGIQDAFDATVAVVADEETRRARAAERSHSGLGGRNERQLSQEEKARRADYVVRNDGSLEDLANAVATVIEELRRKAVA